MKYILADNKIYETKKLIKVEDTRFPKGYMTIEGVALIAIKQADTIEELCDEFVILGQHYRITGYGIITIYNNYVRAIVRKFGKAKQSYNKNKGFALYGAIWTDKGLIYVAKMNEKGELELI